MNFLSHYYFEKENQDSHLVLGTVLPDLIKNGKKEWNLHPQKCEENFTSDSRLYSLLQGWKRHLAVDKLFHSSSFFDRETVKLKQLLLPILAESPVRPSFLAHIGVELMLDHLLVAQNRININAFYAHLDQVDDEVLAAFLHQCNAIDEGPFFKFLYSFKSSKYLLSYQKIENISYALQRICMRLWLHPFNENTLLQLSKQLEVYKLSLSENYLEIFREVEGKLKVES